MTHDDHKTVFLFEDEGIYLRIKDILERPPVKPHHSVLKVRHYGKGQDAIHAIEQWNGPLPDAALLDVDEDGYTNAGIDICKRIRDLWSGVPVMFLSKKDRCTDQVQGLEAGGLSYWSKDPLLRNTPGCEEALRANVNSLIGMIVDPSPPNKYCSGSLCVNMDAGDIRWRKKKLRLSMSEMGIVDELARPGNAGTMRDNDSLVRAGGMSGKPWGRTQRDLNLRQRIRLIRRAFEAVDEKFQAAWKEGRHGIIAGAGGYGSGYKWIPDEKQSKGLSALTQDDGGAEGNG